MLAFDDRLDIYWHHQRPSAAGRRRIRRPAFTAAPTSGTAPLNVQFTNTSTGTAPLTYAWDFGDRGVGGQHVDATNPSHTYTSAGTYTVKLTVTGERQQLDDTARSSRPAGRADRDDHAGRRMPTSRSSRTRPTNELRGRLTVRTREDPSWHGSTYRTYLRFNVTG